MLKLSTKGRYAVRIMTYLATQPEGIPLRKQDIAEAEGISPDYVEQILMRLRSAGLVASHRGARGGFTLARPPAGITVLEALTATEGAVQMAPCSKTACERDTVCASRPVWKAAEDAVAAVFSRTTIARLAESVADIRANKQISYDI